MRRYRTIDTEGASIGAPRAARRVACLGLMLVLVGAVQHQSAPAARRVGQR